MADWDTRGNNIVGGDFLGTTNAQPLSIRTNNAERLLIGGRGGGTWKSGEVCSSKGAHSSKGF
jgi:hypothetical protein